MKLSDSLPILWPDLVSPVGAASFHAPIDFAYLSQQTLGDEALERELLGIFADQTLEIVAALAVVTGEPGRRHADLAHLIKGSARAIGAAKLAAAAQTYEQALLHGAGLAPFDVSRAALIEAAREACEAARRRTGGAS